MSFLDGLSDDLSDVGDFIAGSNDPSTLDSRGLTQADRRQGIYAGLTQLGGLLLAAGQPMYGSDRARILAQIGSVPATINNTETARQQQQMLGMKNQQNVMQMQQMAQMRAMLQSPEFQKQMAGLDPATAAMLKAAAAGGDMATVAKIYDSMQPKMNAYGVVFDPRRGSWTNTFTGQSGSINPQPSAVPGNVPLPGAITPDAGSNAPRVGAPAASAPVVSARSSAQQRPATPPITIAATPPVTGAPFAQPFRGLHDAPYGATLPAVPPVVAAPATQQPAPVSVAPSSGPLSGQSLEDTLRSAAQPYTRGLPRPNAGPSGITPNQSAAVGGKLGVSGSPSAPAIAPAPAPVTPVAPVATSPAAPHGQAADHLAQQPDDGRQMALVNGKPTPVYSTSVNGKAALVPVNPTTSASMFSGRDDDYLRQLYAQDPTLARQVRQVADYQLRINDLVRGRGMMGQQQINQLTNALAQYAPDYSANQYAVRQGVMKDYSPAGKTGQQLRALDTLYGHIGQLADNIDAMSNGPNPAYNAMQLWLKQQTGSPVVGNYDIVKNAVTDELAKVLSSGHITDAETSRMLAPLKAANSPAALYGALGQALNLTESRLDPIANGWEQAMNAPFNYHFTASHVAVANRAKARAAALSQQYGVQPQGGSPQGAGPSLSDLLAERQRRQQAGGR